MIGLNKDKLRKQGFTQDQIAEIFQGIEENVNVGYYLELCYSGLQMHEIRLGLLEGIDVSVYCKPEYDWFQMEELRKGLTAKVDTSLYEDVSIPYRKMREMRRGLQIGHDLTSFLKYDAGTMREYRKALEESIDLSAYLEKGYNADQLEQIRLSKLEQLNIDPYLDLEYTGAALQEIRRGLADGVEIKKLSDAGGDWRKMRELRLGLKYQLDICRYNNHYYSWQQMRELRLGLMQGLDITQYDSLVFPAAEMHRIRLALAQELKEALEQKKARETVRDEDYAITFSDHDLEATISFWGDTTHLTEQSINALLEKSNITYGIHKEAISAIIESTEPVTDLLIASGTAPINGENGHFEFFFRTNVSRTPKILEDGSADYLNLEWFESVKEGQKLAVYHEATQGIDAYLSAVKLSKPKMVLNKKY